MSLNTKKSQNDKSFNNIYKFEYLGYNYTMPKNISIFYKKPKTYKEILPFADRSVKKIPFTQNSVFLDTKGRTWHSTLNKDIVYTLEGFLFETRNKKRLTLIKIMDYWD